MPFIPKMTKINDYDVEIVTKFKGYFHKNTKTKNYSQLLIN